MSDQNEVADHLWLNHFGDGSLVSGLCSRGYMGLQVQGVFGRDLPGGRNRYERLWYPAGLL